MRVGSLFSGGGLGDFGFLMAGCEIVFQVEIDEYCQKLLALRYPDAKRFRDIRTVKGSDLPECDILTGGFPCQPFSVAGKQDGAGDNRYLWPEMSRIISEVKPTWVVAENVPGIIELALDDVLYDLEAKGYETITLVFPAHAFGAPHRRDRVWIIAHSKSGGAGENQRRIRSLLNGHSERIQTNAMGHAGLLGQKEHEKQTAGVEQSSKDVDNSDSVRSQRSRPNEHQEGRERQEQRPSGLCDVFTRWWEVEPAVGGTFDGYPRWLDQHITKEMSAYDWKRTTEILRKVWNPVLSKTVWQTIGGLDRIQKAEILLSIVCRYQKEPDKARILLESQKAFEEEVRSLWEQGKITGSSYGPDEGKQSTFKHPNSLQKLSRLLAHNMQENWSLSSWEDGIARVISGKVPNRVHRLKCLGNGQVSFVTKWIAEQIIECELKSNA